MKKPKTGNLYRWTDISIALEKIVKAIEDPTSDESLKFIIKNDKPFTFRMRIYQYIKAYRKLAEETGEGDPTKYDVLKINEVDNGVEIMHILDDVKELEIVNANTGEKI
mgnify:FL=1|jgi:hypothetical protein